MKLIIIDEQLANRTVNTKKDKQEVMGLGRIHIQAKRYARDNKISREEIQKFVGTLAGAQSSKSVFADNL